MTVERSSPCKVNLLLNILGRRPDGFHELETIMQPVGLCDELRLDQAASGLALTCSDSSLPVDGANLAHRAASAFLQAADIHTGVRIHLEKRIPVAAGLGGGSGNAAATLLGLNELFDGPLDVERLRQIAATLGSDVPFFLQTKPALAVGRGERVESLEPFPVLRDAFLLLIHPGFGISTAWAYRQLADFPEALNGRTGRARELISLLEGNDLRAAGRGFYNSLEAPALRKYPLLAIFQEFLREQGAEATLMSGSGSATFALARGRDAVEQLREGFLGKFGATHWTAVVSIAGN